MDCLHVRRFLGKIPSRAYADSGQFEGRADRQAFERVYFYTFPPSIMDARLKRARGKRYAEKKALVTESAYELAQAMELLTQVSATKFDATAEVHIRINADTTQADQLVRGTVSLPHGTGKTVRIAAFVTEDKEKEAKDAGADHVGNEALIKKVEGGMMDFDIAVAMPQLMKDLGKLAKILGPKGLMPNPKSGTVSDKPGKIIEELKKGRIEFKMDKQGIIHTTFGKVSFGAKKLEENLQMLLQAVKDAQPSGIKGIYIASISVNPTMGPAMKLKM